MKTIKIADSPGRKDYNLGFGREELILDSVPSGASPSGTFLRVYPKNNDPCVWVILTESEALELAFALFDTVGELKPELIKTEE